MKANACGICGRMPELDEKKSAARCSHWDCAGYSQEFHSIREWNNTVAKATWLGDIYPDSPFVSSYFKKKNM